MTRHQGPAVWPQEIADLIGQVKALGPASAPFQLRSGCRVTDPALFHKALVETAEAGPKNARARLGAIQGDLRDYIAHRKATS